MYAIDEARVPRMKAGQVYCPVCMQPADETAINKPKRKMLWWHYGRKFPCVKKLSGQERNGASARPVADTTATDREV
jgi:hypothetical protein